MDCALKGSLFQPAYQNQVEDTQMQGIEDVDGARKLFSGVGNSGFKGGYSRFGAAYLVQDIPEVLPYFEVFITKQLRAEKEMKIRFFL